MSAAAAKCSYVEMLITTKQPAFVFSQNMTHSVYGAFGDSHNSDIIESASKLRNNGKQTNEGHIILAHPFCQSVIRVTQPADPTMVYN